MDSKSIKKILRFKPMRQVFDAIIDFKKYQITRLLEKSEYEVIPGGEPVVLTKKHSRQIAHDLTLEIETLQPFASTSEQIKMDDHLQSVYSRAKRITSIPDGFHG